MAISYFLFQEGIIISDNYQDSRISPHKVDVLQRDTLILQLIYYSSLHQSQTCSITLSPWMMQALFQSMKQENFDEFFKLDCYSWF